jgi:tRNA dimethylallyltransferase
LPATRPRYAFLSESRVLAIFGPTAAGKSALAHAAALELGGEIVVADPFQRYRGLEIAADAPSEHDRREVQYHLVGDLDLTQTSSVAEYAASAHEVIDQILQRGATPIVTGGTGLYLRAALAELDFPGEVDATVRASVERLVTTDLDSAIAELRRDAPDEAARIDLRNPRRVSRALELARSGTPRTSHDRLWTDSTRHPTLLIGVTRPREVLDGLILTRVHRELADGLVDEIECAIDLPGVSRAALQIIGAKEVLALRAGLIDASALPDLLSARTRKLARAQLTWLRKTPAVQQVALGTGPAHAGLGDVRRHWKERS